MQLESGSTEGSGTSGIVGSATVTGTYGQLTLWSNGSYTYVANQAAADAFDAGDNAMITLTDVFVYTLMEGGTDTANHHNYYYWC